MNLAQQAIDNTRRILADNGLAEWQVNVSPRMSHTLGCCHHNKKLIVLNSFHIWNDSDELVLNTINHEVAHALAGAGVKPHGPEWQAIAVKLGAKPVACVSAEDWKKYAHQPRKPGSALPRFYKKTCVSCLTPYIADRSHPRCRMETIWCPSCIQQARILR